jgi:hypothetical protein
LVCYNFFYIGKKASQPQPAFLKNWLWLAGWLRFFVQPATVSASHSFLQKRLNCPVFGRFFNF